MQGAVIFNREGNQAETVCSGPTRSGECPAVSAGAVRCAGRRIIPLGRHVHVNGEEAIVLNLNVSRDAATCPLEALGV